MKSLLLIIDVQKSFINENTSYLITKIESLVNSSKYNYVAFTKFINDENSYLYKEIGYLGCMTEAERKIMIDTKDNKIFEKNIYTAVNDEFKQYIKENKIDIVYVCGIDTDACVLKTCLDLFENKIPFKVLADYSMSHDGIKNHENALKILERMVGKDKIIKEENQ